MLRSAWLATLLFVGCAPVSESDPEDAGLTDAGVSDAGHQPDTQTRLPRAPMGGGFCCPVGSASCNAFPYGGWVAEDDPTRCP
jgi:hypothetical protein